jgi:hypothetical protein
MIERKVYWQTRLVGGDVWLGDPIEALYLDTTTITSPKSPPDWRRRGCLRWLGGMPRRSLR